METLNSKLLPSSKRLQLIFGIVATVLFASSIVLPLLYLRRPELRFLGSLFAVFPGYLAATLLLAADRKIAIGIGFLFILVSLYPASWLLVYFSPRGGGVLSEIATFFLGSVGLFGIFGGMLVYKGFQKPPTAKKVTLQRSLTIWQKLRSANINALSLIPIVVIAFGTALVIRYWALSVYLFFK